MAISPDAYDDDPEVRQQVAFNTADAKTLQLLACDESVNVRATVAYNPATPSEIRENFAVNEHPLIRWGAARNPSSSMSTLTRLATDVDDFVRQFAYESPTLATAAAAAGLPVKVFVLSQLTTLTADEIEGYREAPEEWLDTLIQSHKQ